ncbi:MAG: 16S rRNA (guanine(527)-N(7))-methyltransferase RsmG [Rhodospirillaceae bacterium]|nr:16S rRNA (guanine(527)-N(7))-methyltransferase RsmG [Rhodospirillaceae bacterium]
MTRGREIFNENISVSRETLSKLDIYEQLLKKWQPKINLISTKTVDKIWERHFFDSAQIFRLLPRGTKSILDIGTGAGFPGLVLSIMGMPGVNLVEPDKKKCYFLAEVLRSTATSATLHPCRIENVPKAKYDVVTARALAPLDRLIPMVRPYFGPETIGVFPKGHKVKQELTATKKNWKMDIALIQSISDSRGKIVVIKDILGEPNNGQSY